MRLSYSESDESTEEWHGYIFQFFFRCQSEVPLQVSWSQFIIFYPLNYKPQMTRLWVKGSDKINDKESYFRSRPAFINLSQLLQLCFGYLKCKLKMIKIFFVFKSLVQLLHSHEAAAIQAALRKGHCCALKKWFCVGSETRAKVMKIIQVILDCEC